MATRKRDPETGFTYLELLVSLALLAVMSVLLGGAFGFNQRVWERGAQLESREDLAISRLMFRKHLEGAVSSQVPQRDAAFVGSARGFELQGRIQTPDGSLVGDARLALEVVADGPSQRLVWSFTTNSRSRESAQVTQETLATNLRDVWLSYLEGYDTGAEHWQPQLERNTTHPTLIKIEASKANGRPWPPLVISPGKALRQREISASSLVPPG